MRLSVSLDAQNAVCALYRGHITQELPADGFNMKQPRAKDCWAFGMAQIFSTVSPEMHNEFEIELVKPLLREVWASILRLL